MTRLYFYCKVLLLLSWPNATDQLLPHPIKNAISPLSAYHSCMMSTTGSVPLQSDSNRRRKGERSMATSYDDDDDNELELDPSIAKEFKIKICTSTSCSKTSNKLGLDEYALFSGIFQRKEESGASSVQVEEGPCMGRCKYGPCIGVEHDDYEGFVGLEGMQPNELSHRVFENIVTESDLDRVWNCVENGIRTLARESQDME